MNALQSIPNTPPDNVMVAYGRCLVAYQILEGSLCLLVGKPVTDGGYTVGRLFKENPDHPVLNRYKGRLKDAFSRRNYLCHRVFWKAHDWDKLTAYLIECERIFVRLCAEVGEVDHAISA